LTALATTITRQNRMQIPSVNLNLYDDRVERWACAGLPPPPPYARFRIRQFNEHPGGAGKHDRQDNLDPGSGPGLDQGAHQSVHLCHEWSLDARVLKELVGQFALQEGAQALRACDMVAKAQEPQQRAPRGSQNLAGSRMTSERSHFLDHLFRDAVGEKSAVDCARGGADDEVGSLPGL
jgi:hypothetical protein